MKIIRPRTLSVTTVSSRRLSFVLDPESISPKKKLVLHLEDKRQI